MAAIHIIFLILICCSDHVVSSNNTIIRGVYYPSWAKDTLKPSDINTNYFTHIYYAFLNPSNVTFKFNITTESTFLKLFTSTLCNKNPPVKTIFSIGGGGVVNLFPAMTSKQNNRKAFIDSCIDVARTFGFDGFDLDYEYPKDANEMNNLALLFKEWRAAVKIEANKNRMPQLLITAAVYYSATRDGVKYPADSIKQNLDWINVMNYDYHGGWDTTATGAHAALFDPMSNVNTNYGTGSWIVAGVPKGMVMMGMPMYARTWKLKNPKQAQGVGAPAVGLGPGDPDGTMIYADVVKFNKVHKVKGVFDKVTVSEYSVANSSWIGYDGPTTVGAKVMYARVSGLGGYFFWSAQQDYNWELSKAAFDFW